MFFEDYLTFFLGLTLGVLLCLQFIVVPIYDDKEQSCYEYYKSSNGYILDSCKEYTKKWRDLDEFKTETQVSE